MMKDHEHLQSAAAATKRKQRERRLPEELLEIQMNDTAARAIARADPEVRQVEQQHNTAARAIARTDPEVRRREQQQTQEINHKKFFPLSLSLDEISGQYKFDQPCGLRNKPCVHGCGYIHFSAATTGTMARCCAGGLLSSNSTNADMDLLVNCELDEMPDYLLQCIESSKTFPQDSSTYNNILAMAATKVCNYSSNPGWTSRGPGSAAVTLNGRVHHFFPNADSSDPSCGLSYFIFDTIAAQAGSSIENNIDRGILSILREGLKANNPYCKNLQQIGIAARAWQSDSNRRINIIPTMPNQEQHLDVCSVINTRQNNHLVLG